MRILYLIKNFLRPSLDAQIEPEVRKHFKRNFITNTLDSAVWFIGDSFVSVNAILPVFASTMTDSAIVIGLVTALVNAGWFIPQFFLAEYVRNLKRKLPFAKSLALVERIPYLILPLTALLLHWISGDIAIWIFMFVIAWRGFASGMVALPWQELIATVIPSPVRSRFFGVSRMLGMIGAVLGSIISGIILSKLAYPNNYALSFLIGAGFVWLSYIFFSRTIEPVNTSSTVEVDSDKPLIDLAGYRQILKSDKNFNKYIISRIFFQIGSMATGFLAVYGIHHYSLSDEYAAIFSGLLFASGILGNIFWSILGDRVGPRKTLLFSSILQAFVLVFSLLSVNVWIYYLVFLFYGFAQSGFIIGEMILGMELGTEKDRPLYIGLARSIPGLFILIAPILGGLIVQWAGYQNMFVVALIFYFISIIFIIRVHERDIN